MSKVWVQLVPLNRNTAFAIKNNECEYLSVNKPLLSSLSAELDMNYHSSHEAVHREIAVISTALGLES